MQPIVPYKLTEVKNELKRKAIEAGFVDAQYEGSNVSQLINLLAYSNVINNTNLSYGLNEMFISQATDVKNVIKHARQMGYINKRNISFQYKIKLNVLKTGIVTLDKYTKFTSEGNNYIYLGDSITDTYGTYSYLKILTNENNNGIINNFYDNNFLISSPYIASEDGNIYKVLEKNTIGSPRLLIESINNNINIISTIPKAIYTWDGVRDSVTNYRDLRKLGIIETFLYDQTAQTFKIQITPDVNTTFPIFTEQTHNSTIVKNSTGFILQDNTIYPIKTINSIIIDGTINYNVSNITFVENTNNITIQPDNISVSEKHNDQYISNGLFNIDTNNNIITGSVLSANIIFPAGNRLIDGANLKVSGNTITIPDVFTDKIENGLTVSGGTITLTNNIASIYTIYM